MQILEQYDYHLPDKLIAKSPCDQRSHSRLMQVNRQTGQLSHHRFHQLTDFLKSNDLIVFNNTKVVKARLYGQKTTGGQVEVFIEQVQSDQLALAMIKASKSPKIGAEIHLNTNQQASVLGINNGLYQLSLNTGTWWQLMEEQGEVPLPPYLKRQATEADEDRYQSIFAQHPGAVAAPTASLHFDAPLLDRLQAKGVNIGYLTLHIGAGTFLPLREQHIKTNTLHTERLEITEQLLDQIDQCQKSGGRVVAVGTTVVRALESTFQKPPEQRTGACETNIFIQPGFEFSVTDVMITNFHLPKSSLLMLVASFASLDLMKKAYQTAVTEEYRFYSYGDAMIIT